MTGTRKGRLTPGVADPRAHALTRAEGEIAKSNEALPQTDEM